MPKTITLNLTVTPNARQSEIISREGNNWKVRVAAKPVEGAANVALIALVAKEFGVAKSMVEITHGHRGRKKRVNVYLSN